MKFNNDFIWGVATSSYQIEGGNLEYGKQEDIWDDFSKWPSKVINNDNGLIACDHIHRYKEDIAIMKNLGINAYRFSVSWPRIINTKTHEINSKGIQFYHNLIDELINNSIEPYLTLYHWDLPKHLQQKGGWINNDIVDEFAFYAKVISQEYSGKVKYYFTLNEPQCFCGLGYVVGDHAPGWKVNYSDSLQVIHNALLSHGAAVLALRENAKQKIYIGYAPTSTINIPKTIKKDDIKKAREEYFALKPLTKDFFWSVSLYSDPIILGDYPKEYYKLYKGYHPKITKEDLKLINQPLDFLGQNIYFGTKDFTSSHPHTDMNWPIVPESLYWGPKFLYERYNLPIYITENGLATADQVSSDGKVHDQQRIDFIEAYLKELSRAIVDKVDIKGYFHWSLLDNYEWTWGYSKRFGIVHVDFETQKRTIKESGLYYKAIIKSNGKIL